MVMAVPLPDPGVNVIVFVPEPPDDPTLIAEDERLCVNTEFTVTVKVEDVAATYPPPALIVAVIVCVPDAVGAKLRLPLSVFPNVLVLVAVPIDVLPSLKVIVPVGAPKLLLPVTVTESVVELPRTSVVEVALGVEIVGTAILAIAATRLLTFTVPSPVAVS